MKIITIPPQGVFAVNSYLVISEKGNAALIDAPAGGERILAEARKNGAEIKKILITHGHCDHIESLAEIAEETGAQVYIHTLDAPKLTDSYTNLSDYFSDYLHGSAWQYDKAETITDGDIITLDELSFTVMHTPGHTGGSVCYIIGDVMFSGDTLFKSSVGRTDMPDGDTAKLLQSLKRLAEIDGDYRLLSGHGGESKLSREKISNPYMSGSMFDY